MSSLIDVANRLKASRISNIVRDLREPRAALRRVVLLLVYTMVVYLVSTRGGATGLQKEAQGVLQVMAAFLVVSSLWVVFLRLYPAVQERLWVDNAGSIANFVGVAVLLHLAWNVTLPFVATLPLSCITIGALHGRRTFFASIAISTLIVFSSSPESYWLSRPFVGMLALALLIGLPLTVTRLMIGLREISVEAINARDAQGRFLATMSHELRTPLSSVVAASELIAIEENPERQRQLMQILSINALVLRNRVNDVLDVRTIEGGSLVFNNEPFTFAALFRTLGNVILPQAREKHIELHFAAYTSSDRVLRSDPARIEQMLSNICTNAVKFTPPGGKIEVSFQSWPVEGNDKVVNVELSVADTGIGIANEVKRKVFDPFYQVSAGVARSAEGIGLGLFIVSRIARMMGGTIDLHDNPGGGSVFTLVLQLEVAPPGEKPTSALDHKEAFAEHRRKVRSMRVLVVDDNASNREIATRILQQAGHSFVTAASGDEAIRLFESDRFDLMLLDLFMPGTSGWTLLDRYQKYRRAGKSVAPICVLSADANPEARDAALAKGAVAYLLKPLSISKVLQLLSLVASGVTRTKRMIGEDEAKPVAWIDYLRSEGNPEVLRHFVETCMEGLDKGTSGLKRALREKDTENCLFFAHALKNDFIHLGYRPGIEACKDFPDRLVHGEGEKAFAEIADHAMEVKSNLASELAST